MTPPSHPPHGDIPVAAIHATAPKPSATTVTLAVGSNGDIDWPRWLRETERKRRQIARQPDGQISTALRPFWSTYYVSATEVSFRLDGMPLSHEDLVAALARGSAGKPCRSRQQQRGRNHVAILRRLETFLHRGTALKPDDVVRWYTSIACGLSTTQLDEPSRTRLDGIVRQINSPHLRLCPALQGIARLHAQMLADPVVPSFNGILARLLLRYHLGRCGLPPVVFSPETDNPEMMQDEQRLLSRLLEMIDKTHDTVLRGSA